MVNLLCYEPAGQVLQFGQDDLLRHILGVGATGSGKTTALVNPLLDQLIAWNAKDEHKKAGLLVLDPKDDDTLTKVRHYARKADRVNDVVVLSLSADESHYGYFTDFRRLEQVDEFSARVLFGSRDMGIQNAYWSEARFGFINSALTVLLASDSNPTFDSITEFLRRWFFDPQSDDVKQRIDFVARLIGISSLYPTTRRRLELALVDARNWRDLDQRTRELHKSSVNNALRALLSPAARDLFDERRGPRFNPAEALNGKILVASVNAIAHPGLASMVFKSLKRDFYHAVFAQQTWRPERNRMSGLILDEFPLSALPDDADALALLRSKGSFVVACTQSISALDEVLGYTRRCSLLTNFNSVLYFSSRDDQTDAHASLTLGFHDRAPAPPQATDEGDIQILERMLHTSPTPVCPPGALARLASHHAFAKLANGTITKTPVWIAPTFHDFEVPPSKVEPDDLARAAASLRDSELDDQSQESKFALFMIHMHRRKHKLKLTPDIVAATWLLCRPRTQHNRILAKLTGVIQGIEGLPPCWLIGFHRWLRRNRSLAPSVLGVSVRGGALWCELDPAFTNWGDGKSMIPEAINRFVYPSLWRPLLPRHLKYLMVHRPDLRSKLQVLPQVEKGDGAF